ncbi:MAG: biopolymer transporter ExbD [Elusimicrobiota bacterium]
MEFEGRKKVRLFLNITPLIDVVFLLLIFFMLSSHFVVQLGIKITLPQAKTSKLHSEEEIIIFISSDNRLYFNKKSITLDSLFTLLEKELRKSERNAVIVKADEKINLGLAVKVMDIAKDAGAEGVIISTKIEEKDDK